MKTTELIGPALDWAVAKCMVDCTLHKDALLGGSVMEGWWVAGYYMDANQWVRLSQLRYSTEWSQGGPIIERECIDMITASNTATGWFAQLGIGSTTKGLHKQYGPTPLIAAMRCFCASRLGDEVGIPEELLK